MEKKRKGINLVHDTVSGFIHQQEFSKSRDHSTEKLLQSQGISYNDICILTNRSLGQLSFPLVSQSVSQKSSFEFVAAAAVIVNQPIIQSNRQTTERFFSQQNL